MKNNVLMLLVVFCFSTVVFSQEKAEKKLDKTSVEQTLQKKSDNTEKQNDAPAPNTKRANVISLKEIKKKLLETHEENNQKKRNNIVINNNNKRTVVLDINSTKPEEE